MSSQDRCQLTITTAPNAGRVTSTSAETTAIPPSKGPTYNPNLAAALDKHLFSKKPTPTALNKQFFGKNHTPTAETMTPSGSGDTRAYHSRLARLNQRLASEPAATTSSDSPVVSNGTAAPIWLPKTAMVKPRKGAVVPRGKQSLGKPQVATYAPLEGLGQTINGEFVNVPGRFQGYGTRIPYASFVHQYTKPVQEVEYENVPGRYQGYGTRIPYASVCSQYPGASFTVKGEPDYSVQAQCDTMKDDDALFRGNNVEKEEK